MNNLGTSIQRVCEFRACEKAPSWATCSHLNPLLKRNLLVAVHNYIVFFVRAFHFGVILLWPLPRRSDSVLLECHDLWIYGVSTLHRMVQTTTKEYWKRGRLVPPPPRRKCSEASAAWLSMNPVPTNKTRTRWRLMQFFNATNGSCTHLEEVFYRPHAPVHQWSRSHEAMRREWRIHKEFGGLLQPCIFALTYKWTLRLFSVTLTTNAQLPAISQAQNILSARL